MEQRELKTMLAAVRTGRVPVAAALKRLADLPFGDIGVAKVDHHRSLRTGWPEVIFCQGKTLAQVKAIVAQQVRHNETVLGTRASGEILEGVAAAFPGVSVNAAGRCFSLRSRSWRKRRLKAPIVIAAAGTADLPVAEEARFTVETLGCPCAALYDVGVAGIHRLFAHRETMQAAPVVIVIAGMEGALPSVVAGLVSCPVIGVPTSVGYGSHLGGLVPLFAMLNSCAAGMTVVNIDNGFGAAFAAVLIACGRR
jgi:pyridinium-3,5-biscarboxylic acid mononucleotide synthase